MNTPFKGFGFRAQSKKTMALGLAAIVGLASVLPSALAAPPNSQPQQQTLTQSQLKARQQAYQQEFQRKRYYEAQMDARLKKLKPIDRQDLLLVMPNAKSDKEALSDACEQVKGEILMTVGTGAMQILIVKAEHGKAAQTQQKLLADGHFSAVDMNEREKSHWIQPIYKEPKLADSWHLYRMHAPDVYDWLFHQFNHELIAVLDSGLQGSECSRTGQGVDATGVYKMVALKAILGMVLGFPSDSDIEHWGNYIQTMTYCINDNNGHGTWVSSTAAGSDNGQCSLGVNPRAQIFPVRIADGPPGDIYTDELTEIAAMLVLCQANVRICNISYGGVANPKKKVLHAIMQYYHDVKNGLIFCSAGNDGQALSYPPCRYINVVSAMEKADKGLKLADKAVNGVFSSNYGPCVTFTAPGSVINCADTMDKPAVVYGTSFSSPIVAGVASLIWTANRNLRNTEVEAIMMASCENSTGGRNSKFGYGMPDCAKAVRLAMAWRR